MAIIKTAPYGEWKSAISAEAATAGSRSLNCPRVCPETGRSFFLESRPDGSNGIVEITPDGPEQILPAEYGANTTVYEYGGLPYAVVPGRALRIVFSDSRKQSLNLLYAEDEIVETIVQSSALRYADFDCYPDIWDDTEAHSWVLAVEEDHTDPRPKDVKNYIVAINVSTKEVKRIAEGADFYSFPRFSPDGTEVAWLQWNHPGLPFKGAQLYLADFNEYEGTISEARVVAGDEEESVAEPRWSPDGQLFFASDKTGFRQLCRLVNGERERIVLPGLEEAEFGKATWMSGCQSYTFLTEDVIVAAAVQFGEHHLIYIDLAAQDWAPIDVPLYDFQGDCLAALSGTSFFVIGSGHTTPRGIYRIDLFEDLEPELTLISSSVDHQFAETQFSTPVPITFTTLRAPHREVHGFYWPPHNPRYKAPEGELPPLIVNSHGGPTGHCPPGLDMRMQYFTSRGYAWFAINYTGSSGYGKAYRDALNGEWGILDREDVAEAIDYLAFSGRIDRDRVGIEGGSAGGFNVLCSLTWHPDLFAGGVCYCGVSDIKNLDAETHKMESHYLETLLNLKGKTQEEKEALFRERSPLYHADNITAPLLLVHGDRDTVVPIEQSREIRRKLKLRGVNTKMIELEGEGHMFEKAESWLKVVIEGEKWWRKSLLKLPNSA